MWWFRHETWSLLVGPALPKENSLGASEAIHTGVSITFSLCCLTSGNEPTLVSHIISCVNLKYCLLCWFLSCLYHKCFVLLESDILIYVLLRHILTFIIPHGAGLVGIVSPAVGRRCGYILDSNTDNKCHINWLPSTVTLSHAGGHKEFVSCHS
jgi:hypothetical protein